MIGAEYRIEYTIQRRDVVGGEDDFTEIGFGSSGGWGSVDQAIHMAASDIQNRQWETTSGMPDPSTVDR